ncbi:MAG: N-acetylmuramoyl-L-alanine amidase [Succinivibrionaceae bacterium]
MHRLIVFLILMVFGTGSLLANEIVGLRSTVQKDKTRMVFDLKDKPTYKVSKIAPYQVALDISDIPSSAPLPRITGQALGEMVDEVQITRISGGARYLFILKWNLDPVNGSLAPQGKYKNYRVYLDFLASRISGAPRGTGDLPREKDKKGTAQGKISSHPRDILEGKSREVDQIRVLTPEDAQRHQEEVRRNNLRQMERIEAEKKALAEAEAKKKALAEAETKKKALAEAETKKKALAEAEAKKKALAEADAKKKADAEKKALTGKNDQNRNDKQCLKNSAVIIAIDPGHGGKDPGAIGDGKVYEKNVTLAISRALYRKINASSGMQAILTRTGDHFVELDRRSEIARVKNADILISIHADAATNKKAKGASVLVLNNDRAGRENRKVVNSSGKQDSLLGGASEVLEETAANGENNQYIKNMIIDLTSGKSRDTGYDLANRIISRMSGFVQMHKSRPDERSLAVLKAPDIPSILVETGFISNPKEAALLKNTKYQEQIAEAIYQALRDHLSDPRYKVHKCR